jgi:biopolymer transport protein ExbD
MASWRNESEAAEVPLTPLIDVVFLLLIFFLVATTFSRREVDERVRLPEGVRREAPRAAEEAFVINLRREGVLVVDGRVVEERELGTALRAWRGQHPERGVAIRGDEGVAYGRVARVLGLVRGAGITRVDLPVYAATGE